MDPANTESALELLAYLICSALIAEPSVNFAESSVTVSGGIEHLEAVVARALGTAVAVMPLVQTPASTPVIESRLDAPHENPQARAAVFSPSSKYH